MGIHAERNCRVEDKAIFGGHIEAGSVFRWINKAETHSGDNSLLGLKKV